MGTMMAWVHLGEVIYEYMYAWLPEEIITLFSFCTGGWGFAPQYQQIVQLVVSLGDGYYLASPFMPCARSFSAARNPQSWISRCMHACVVVVVVVVVVSIAHTKKHSRHTAEVFARRLKQVDTRRAMQADCSPPSVRLGVYLAPLRL